MSRELKEALTDELDRLGVAWRIENGGSHPSLVFAWNGTELRHAFPSTESDWRSGLNSLADLRRRLGIRRESDKAPIPVREARRERNRKRRAERSTAPVCLPVETGSVACRLNADPRDVLKELMKKS